MPKLEKTCPDTHLDSDRLIVIEDTLLRNEETENEDTYYEHLSAQKPQLDAQKKIEILWS